MDSLLGMKVRARILNVCSAPNKTDALNQVLERYDEKIISVQVISENRFLILYRL